PCRLGEERNTGSAREFRAIRAEVRAEIAYAAGREECVRRCVGHRIAVGMAREAALTFPVKPTKPERPRFALGSVGVHVDADAGAWQQHEILQLGSALDEANAQGSFQEAL